MGVAAGVNPANERRHYDLCHLWEYAKHHFKILTEIDEGRHYNLAHSSSKEFINTVRRIGIDNLIVDPEVKR
ncbi:MAG: hypothetical protein ABUJ98_14540 [Hyphomicrobium sp.]